MVKTSSCICCMQKFVQYLYCLQNEIDKIAVVLQTETNQNNTKRRIQFLPWILYSSIKYWKETKIEESIPLPAMLKRTRLGIVLDSLGGSEEYCTFLVIGHCLSGDSEKIQKRATFAVEHACKLGYYTFNCVSNVALVFVEELYLLV
ncbi:conserved domain protein [Trichinella spiralis]|uniref:hypothetical protein n=1 Tax=Trichinella spiralis TaxID=6334 RepID=UPI0001EFB7DB|nr:conserved domain protein [Trichinella spiralis]